MNHVSNNFIEELNKDNRHYLKYADITLTDGTKLPIDNSNIWSDGFKIDDAVTSDGNFDIGAAIVNKFSLTISNFNEEYRDYVFEDAEVVAYIGLELPNKSIEKIKKGVFTITKASGQNGSLVTLEAYDNMKKFDVSYSKSSLSYPATLNAIVRDACTVCGVVMGTTSFDNDDIVVKEKPNSESLTFRTIISYAAQMSGNWARCNANGYLELKWYEEFNDITDNSSDEHRITDIVSRNIDLKDVEITGINVSVANDEGTTEYFQGEQGYVLSISDNSLISKDNVNRVCLALAEKCIGLSFRPMDLTCLSNPTIEAGDKAWVLDYKGNVYRTYINRTIFSTGFQSVFCEAEPASRKNRDYYNETSRTNTMLKEDVRKERTARETALKDLADRVSQSQGLFTTEEVLEDGGSIFYLHNKPKLNESNIIWEMTVEAWRVSTDGGTTWNAGMTVDGNAITNILTSIGINADWINAGSVKGEYIDAKKLSVQDANKQKTLEIDENGNVSLSVVNLKLHGKTIENITAESDNLLLSPIDFSSTYWDTQGTINRGLADPDGGNNATSLRSTLGQILSTNSSNKPISGAGTYKVSIWMKVQNAGVGTIQFGGVNQTVDLTTGWKQYVLTYVASDEASSPQLRILTVNGRGTTYYYKPRVVKSFTQEEVFNTLTNNGEVQGIYMQDNKLYINASYIDTGSLAGWTINKANQKITSPDGIIVLDAKNEKIIINGVEMKAYGSGLVVSRGLTVECGNDEFSDGTDGFQLLNLNTVTSGNYLRISNGYVSQSSSSSERYKDIYRVLTDEDIESAYNIEVYDAKYKDEYLSEKDERYGKSMPMFVVENMEKYLPIAVDHNKDGIPEMWNSNIMIPLMFQMIKSQKKEIEQLKKLLLK